MVYIVNFSFTVQNSNQRSSPSIQQRLTEKKVIGDSSFKIGETYTIVRIWKRDNKFCYQFMNSKTRDIIEKDFLDTASADGFIKRLI